LFYYSIPRTWKIAGAAVGCVVAAGFVAIIAIIMVLPQSTSMKQQKYFLALKYLCTLNRQKPDVLSNAIIIFTRVNLIQEVRICKDQQQIVSILAVRQQSAFTAAGTLNGTTDTSACDKLCQGVGAFSLIVNTE
jgi:hypothetical protein